VIHLSDEAPTLHLPTSTIWTIGYAGRSMAELQQRLKQHRIDLLVDIRRWPQSRRRLHSKMPRAEIQRRARRQILQTPRPD